MENNNNVKPNITNQNIQPETNPVDQIASDAGLPPAPQPETEIGPSTTENQQETQNAREDWIKKVKNKQAEIASRSKSGMKTIEFSEAQDLLIQEQRKKDEEEAAKQKEIDAKNAQEKLELDRAVEKYLEGKKYRQENNQPFIVNEELEEYISQREQEENLKLQEEQDAKAKELAAKKEAEDKALEEKKAQEEAIKRAEAEQEAKEIRKAQTEQEAIQKVALENQIKQEEENRRIQQKMEEEDKSQNFTNYKEYWESRTTGQKIITGIGLFLGALGGASDQEGALGVINKAIEKNIQDKIEANKIAKEDYWKQKEYDLKVVETQLKKMAQNTKNKEVNIKIQQMLYKTQKDMQASHEKRALNEKLKSSTTFTRDEILDMQSKDEKLYKEKNRFIQVSEKFNEKTKRIEPIFVYAPSGDREALKKLSESIVAGRKSVKDLEELIRIANMPFGAKFNLFTDKPKADAAAQILIGNMREDLFGPGILTDAERRIAEGIFKKTTDITTIPKSARSSLNYMVQKLKYGLRVRLQGAGVAIPVSKNEANIAALEQGGLKKAEAINTLIRTNKWIQESVTGF